MSKAGGGDAGASVGANADANASEVREFLDAFLAGELDEIELTLEEYGTLFNAVSASVASLGERWQPVDGKPFALASTTGERVLYRKEVRADAPDHDIVLVVEWRSDAGN